MLRWLLSSGDRVFVSVVVVLSTLPTSYMLRSNHFWLRACEINMEIKEPLPGLEPRAHCPPPKPVAHPMAYHSTSSRVPHA